MQNEDLPLHLANTNNNLMFAEILISYGARINEVDEVRHGNTSNIFSRYSFVNMCISEKCRSMEL